MNNEPVFVVGTPRSGTTLLAAMLSAHSRLDCGPETHFFCRLTSEYEKSLSTPQKWPHSAFQYITSLKLARIGFIYKVFDLSKEEIYSFLCSRPPSVNATLEALTYLHALKNKKQRWVEKTPNHLLYLNKIRKYYPKAFIIRILRDFRDVALSLSKVPWGSKSILVNIFKLNEWYYLSENIMKDDRRLLIFSYEKLVSDPQLNLQKCCDFINEKFEFSMISKRNKIQNLYSKNEWWKKNVAGPLDKSRCYVWKREMEADIQLVTTYTAMTMLKKYNYDIDVPLPKETILLFPLTENLVKKNEYNFIEMAKQRIRIVGCSNMDLLIEAISHEKPSEVVFLCPINLSTISQSFSSTQRMKSIFKFLKILDYIKRQKISVSFIERGIYNKLGKSEHIIDYTLKKIARKNRNNFLL